MKKNTVNLIQLQVYMQLNVNIIYYALELCETINKSLRQYQDVGPNSTTALICSLHHFGCDTDQLCIRKITETANAGSVLSLKTTEESVTW